MIFPMANDNNVCVNGGRINDGNGGVTWYYIKLTPIMIRVSQLLNDY